MWAARVAATRSDHDYRPATERRHPRTGDPEDDAHIRGTTERGRESEAGHEGDSIPGRPQCREGSGQPADDGWHEGVDRVARRADRPTGCVLTAVEWPGPGRHRSGRVGSTV